MKPRKLPPEVLRRYAEVLAQMQTFPTPPAELVGRRMAELRELGLEDLPAFEGISSSVRQFAWASVARDLGTLKDAVFVTIDEGLLSRAPLLHERFGMRVMDPAAMSLLAALAGGRAK